MADNEMLVRAGWLITGAFHPVLRDGALYLQHVFTDVWTGPRSVDATKRQV